MDRTFVAEENNNWWRYFVGLFVTESMIQIGYKKANVTDNKAIFSNISKRLVNCLLLQVYTYYEIPMQHFLNINLITSFALR